MRVDAQRNSRSGLLLEHSQDVPVGVPKTWMPVVASSVWA
jgi:hypothetical protein